MLTVVIAAAALILGYGLGAHGHHRYAAARLRWYERTARTRRTVADVVELPGLQAAIREYETDADLWRLPKERR